MWNNCGVVHITRSYSFSIFQLACCVGTSACSLCCKACPSCKNSTSSRIVYALFLLLGVALSCIVLIPGVGRALKGVSHKNCLIVVTYK